ncbi:hypothetical protein F2P81_000713 [Scophthalmus maximus]|uniref:Uncharacterized protein n=1 Tax=Scophthalmus maximus TaxID=52904 RepID=A0A6A4TTW1_SCOMX|nr:hypothetical protein F2P81_000713 [Scophthalmus maximus]
MTDKSEACVQCVFANFWHLLYVALNIFSRAYRCNYSPHLVVVKLRHGEGTVVKETLEHVKLYSRTYADTHINISTENFVLTYRLAFFRKQSGSSVIRYLSKRDGNQPDERPCKDKIIGSRLISALVYGFSREPDLLHQTLLRFSLMKYGFVYRQEQMLIIVPVYVRALMTRGFCDVVDPERLFYSPL